MPKTKNTMIKTVIQHTLPVLEHFLEKIADGEGLDIADLKKKYLSEMKNFKKNKKKSKPSGYSMFLSDKTVTEGLKKKNPKATFGEMSKLRGAMWKGLKESDKNRYKQLADEENLARQENESDSDDSSRKMPKKSRKQKPKKKEVVTSDSDSDVSSDDED